MEFYAYKYIIFQIFPDIYDRDLKLELIEYVTKLEYKMLFEI